MMALKDDCDKSAFYLSLCLGDAHIKPVCLSVCQPIRHLRMLLKAVTSRYCCAVS